MPELNRRCARSLILAFATIAPIATVLLWPVHPVIALVPLFVSHLLILYPTLVPQSQWWGPVLRSFETSAREVWLTIDDGPSQHTAKILDLLDTYDARATFFIVGRRASPDALEAIRARGHTLANHTFTHPRGSFWCALPRQLEREVDSCENVLGPPASAAHYFRAPVGMKNCFLHPALKKRGMQLIGWTVRGFDSWRRNPAAVAGRITKDSHPGAIILLHEGLTSSEDAEFSVQCIELTLRALRERGYRCVIPTAGQLRARLPRSG